MESVFRRRFSKVSLPVGSSREQESLAGAGRYENSENGSCAHTVVLGREGRAGAGLLRFCGWDWKLGPCWDAFLWRQLQPFSKFGWEGKKGKMLCLLIECRKTYLLESFWVEVTIILPRREGSGSTAAFGRYWSSRQDKGGERRTEEQGECEAVHSQITIAVKQL